MWGATFTDETAWRYDYFNSFAGHPARLCLEAPMEAEVHRVGCIFGLSAIYFIFPFGFQTLVTAPADSLPRFCANFVDPARPKPEDAQRWLACVSGATEWYPRQGSNPGRATCSALL